MICSKCGYDNLSGIRVCEKCGARLAKFVIQSDGTGNKSAFSKTVHSSVSDSLSNSEKGFRFASFGETMRVDPPPVSLSIKGNLSATPTDLFCVPASASYPWHRRSPRIKKALPSGEIIIQSPASIGEKPTINWLTVLATPAGMLIIMLVIAFLTNANGTASSMSYFYYMIPMSLIGVVVAILNYRSQIKRHSQQSNNRVEHYESYLHEIQQELAQTADKQKLILAEKDPSIYECFSIVEHRKRRLWERSPQDSDFMCARAGIGCALLCVGITAPPLRVAYENDALEDEARKLALQYRYVSPIPVECDLRRYPSIGIVGDRAAVISSVRSLLISIATHHSYENVKIVMLYAKRESAEWDSFRWMPHVFDEERNKRFIADNKFEASEIIKDFEAIIKQRRRDLLDAKSTNQAVLAPHYLFVIAEPSYLEDSNMTAFLTQNNLELSISAVFLADNLGGLPKGCSQIMEVTGDKGRLYDCQSAENDRSFEIECASIEQIEHFARNLSPIRIQTNEEENDLPNMITFLEGYHVKTPGELPIELFWNNNHANESMRVPIGMASNGELLQFDIHEKKSGPNGLVAGMVGSGKTELLQTWILSMAVNFAPSDVSFILIDFKGSGLLRPFMSLPHLAGTVSDLDTRIDRNLLALQSEVSRRLNMLKKTGCNSILDYQDLHRKGNAAIPMPFIMIVIDEFAEMKHQFPDFMAEIESIIRRGRAIGMYVILATQKPGSVVNDQMYSNTRFRWCLKVASAADSREMLHHSVAVKITNPGRAYIQVGEDEIFEQIQSFWSGAPYSPYEKLRFSERNRIAIISLSGKRTLIEKKEKSSKRKVSLTEIDAVVSSIQKSAISKAITAPKVWPERLPNLVVLDKIITQRFDGKSWAGHADGLEVTVGLVDDPYKQAQYPLVADLSTNGHQIIYGAPQTGKTTFLQTLLVSMAISYSPQEVNLYVIDYGSRSLSAFAAYPHVGGIANDRDSESIDNLVRLLTKELTTRRDSFAAHGVSNIKAYRDIEKANIPYIVLIIDNFGAVRQTHPDLDSFWGIFTQEAGSYGMYMVASAATDRDTVKIEPNIKSMYTLQMMDSYDYTHILRLRNNLRPENVLGRGLVRLEEIVEFQTALPVQGETEGKRIFAIKELGESMCAAWKGLKAKPLPIMPGIIPYGSVSGEDIVFGLSIRDVDTIEHCFRTAPNLLIVGNKNTGKTNMLCVIAQQLSHTEDCEQITVLTTEAEARSIPSSIHCIVHGQDMDDYLQSLVPIFQNRLDARREQSIHSFRPIAILVDNWNIVTNRISGKSQERLAQIASWANELSTYLIVTCDSEAFASLFKQGDAGLLQIAASRYAVVLGGCLRDMESCFLRNFPDKVKSLEVGRNEGFYLTPETAIPFKPMCSQQEDL